MSGVLLLVVAASAGEFDGRVAVDTLTAGTRTEDEAAGAPELSATDVGLSVRGTLVELDDRLLVAVDYRGRVPVAGQFPNREQHLLFRADAAWRAGRVELGLGRFFAPSAIWLSMDGLRATWRPAFSPGSLWFTAFAGRRAISLSRRNLPADVFLPVVGGQIGATIESVTVHLNGNVAGDQLLLGNPGDEVFEDVQAGSVQGKLSMRASAKTSLGASASVANDATFAVGPDAGDLVATVQALSLYRALAYLNWRASPKARISATALHQQVTLQADEALDVALVDPSFTDLRLQSVLGNPAVGFLRPHVRLRARKERLDLRLGVATEVHPEALGGMYGLASGWLEQGLTASNLHVRWKAGVGFERGPGQIEGGIGMVDRPAGPISARTENPDDGQSEDLSPFVLEAQNVAFLRGFFTGRWWFAGLDAEANLYDRELRAFVQIGLIGRSSW